MIELTQEEIIKVVCEISSYYFEPYGESGEGCLETFNVMNSIKKLLHEKFKEGVRYGVVCAMDTSCLGESSIRKVIGDEEYDKRKCNNEQQAEFNTRRNHQGDGVRS